MLNVGAKFHADQTCIFREITTSVTNKRTNQQTNAWSQYLLAQVTKIRRLSLCTTTCCGTTVQREWRRGLRLMFHILWYTCTCGTLIFIFIWAASQWALKLLWQPSDCITIFLMVDIVAIGNKYDDADDDDDDDLLMITAWLNYGRCATTWSSECHWSYARLNSTQPVELGALNLQNLKMTDQITGLENAGPGKWRTETLENDRPLLRPNRNSGSGKCLLPILWKFFYWCTQQ